MGNSATKPGDLLCAAKAGDADGVRQCLARGSAVDEEDEDGWTALFWAADRGDMGAFVNEKDKDGKTVLDIAARNGHTRVVEAPTQLRPSAHQPSPDNESSLQDNWQPSHSRSIEHAEPAEGTTAVQSADTKLELTTVDVPVQAPPEANDHALNQFLVVKLSRVLPNVVTTLQDRCSSMFEAEVMSKRVFGRLQGIFQQLHDIDVIENKIALRHDFVTRLVLCLEMTFDILQFHEDIGRVESALGLPQSSISRQTIEEDRQKLLKTFRDICDDSEIIDVHISNDRARLDAVTLLRNALTRRTRSKSSCVNDYWGIITALEKQLTSSISQPPDVVVADWFVPPHQVECNEKPFSQGSFGAVYLAKMNGADVVVKQVLTFDDGARAQFLKEVQVWSRLRHP
ncbi:Tkl protein kinase, partial [Globisporangium splendens]